MSRKKLTPTFDGFARIRIYEIGNKISITFEMERDKAAKFFKLLKNHEGAKEKS